MKRSAIYSRAPQHCLNCMKLIGIKSINSEELQLPRDSLATAGPPSPNGQRWRQFDRGGGEVPPPRYRPAVPLSLPASLALPPASRWTYRRDGSRSRPPASASASMGSDAVRSVSFTAPPRLPEVNPSQRHDLTACAMRGCRKNEASLKAACGSGSDARPCRLAGLSALEGHYAGVGVGAQRANVRGILSKTAHLSAAFIACRADHAGKAKVVSSSVALRADAYPSHDGSLARIGWPPTSRLLVPASAPSPDREASTESA